MSVKLIIKGKATHYNQHYLLDGLDIPDQHPIEAIIGLKEALESKYVKPEGGIPASDLAETYINIDDLHNTQMNFEIMYNECKKLINENKNEITINQENITINKDDIFNLTSIVNSMKDVINNIPGQDIVDFKGAACVEQKEFEATDTEKVIDIPILSKGHKVIEPTILHEDGALALTDEEYTVSYPDENTMRVEFKNNGKYKINYISGDLTDTEFDILLEYLKKLEANVNNGMAGFGSILKPKHDVELIYNDKGQLTQEIYTGDIKKTISYAYDINGNIISKTVNTDTQIKTASYQYDDFGNLIKIIDNGTEIPINGAKAKKFQVNYEYNSFGNVSKEIFTGDINKVITFSYNDFGDITSKKITENNETKTAQYIYDQNRNLVKIVDDGTEEVAIVFPENSVGSGGTSTGATDFELITSAETDLIFDNIFKELW